MRILNSMTIQVNDGLFQFFIFLLVILTILLLVACIVDVTDGNRKRALTFGALTIVVAACILGTVINWPTITRYEVCFEENVPFTEISEQYNIISQRGDLYILEEKTIDSSDSNP